MKEINELLESALSNIEVIRLEQKQELFEAIRHFTKYKAYALINEELQVPISAYKIHDSIKKLFESEYE